MLWSCCGGFFFAGCGLLLLDLLITHTHTQLLCRWTELLGFCVLTCWWSLLKRTTTRTHTEGTYISKQWCVCLRWTHNLKVGQYLVHKHKLLAKPLASNFVQNVHLIICGEKEKSASYLIGIGWHKLILFLCSIFLELMKWQKGKCWNK